MTSNSEVFADTPRSEDVTTLDSTTVFEYLLNHPEFFQEFPAVLQDLTLKHDSGSAVSLIELQIKGLREKNRKLDKKILNLVQIAQDNEILEEQLHRIARRLIEIEHGKELVPIINDLLVNEFPSLQIRLGLYDIAPDYTLAPQNAISAADLQYPFYKQILEDNVRDCIFLRGMGLAELFFNEVDVKSGVAMPLRSNKNFGVLLLGSSNENRFYEGMGTLFLEYLADLLSRKLKKILKQ
jgi:uncharacterized protein YigA (DUF484 family)